MEFLINFLVGFVFVPILQIVKKYTGLKDYPMFITTIVLCLGGGFLVAMAQGKLDFGAIATIDGFFENIGPMAAAIFAGAQTLYQALKRYLPK